MTEEQIIKALEWHSNDETHCSACPYEEYSVTHYCVDMVVKDALGLVNRQQAEIERLNKQLEEFKFLESRVNSIKNTPKDTFTGILISMAEGVARYEAIEEFAERLKKLKEMPLITNNDIDNLVKEMVGETNAE